MIFNLTYVSVMDDSVSRDQLDELLRRSRQRNDELGITGLLLYRQGKVMQTIEGDEQTVRALFARIRADARHRHVTQIWASSLDDRRFPHWGMGFEALPAMEPSGSAGGDLRSAAGSELTLGTAPGRGLGDPTGGDGRPGHADELHLDDLPPTQAAFVAERDRVLRRALVSGQRLTSALAVILHAHEPAAVLDDEGRVGVSCSQCRNHEAQIVEEYPCFTAENAFWALNATLP